MSVLGIDFGNDKCKVALPAGGKVDIVLNDVTNRETPSCVGFSDEEREIGETGLSSLNMNFANTIRSLKCFLGRKFSEEIVQREIENVPFEVREGNEGSVVFEVDCQGQRILVTPEQVLGALLKRLSVFAEQHTNGLVSGVVVSCPSDYIDSQRRAIYNACCIAGLKCFRVMSQSLAACLQYAFSRLSELPNPDAGENPRLVAIVDYGNCDMEAVVGSFSQEGCKVLGASTGFGLGSRRLDFVIAEYIREDFLKKTRIDVRSNPRAWLRTLAAAERAKRFLSANKVAPINIESFCQDRDYSGSLSRDQLEEMAEPILACLRVPVENALRQSGVTVDQLHSVEIIGGSRMIPAFVRTVESIFGKEPNKTMNATECIASGCAWQGAILSPSYRVRKFKVEDRVPFDVIVKWASASNASSGKWDPEDSGQLFSAGEVYPKAKAIRFREEDDLVIQAEYSVTGEYRPLSDQPVDICEMRVVHPRTVAKPNTKKRELSVQLWTDIHGTVNVRLAKFVEEYEEWETVVHQEKSGDEKKGEKTDSDSKEQAESMEVDEGADAGEKKSSSKGKGKGKEEQVLRTRVRETACEVHIKSHGLTLEQVREFFEEEQNMIKRDQERMEAKDLKNKTESYVLRMRHRVSEGGDLYTFCAPEIRGEFIAIMDNTESWLYDEGFSTSCEEYRERLNTLEGFGQPVLERFEQKQERPECIANLRKTLHNARAWMKTTDEKHEHITAEERQKVLTKCDELEEWLNHAIAALEAQPDYAEPSTKNAMFRSKVHELEKFAVDIMNKPKPEPKKQPEEKKEDVEQPAGSSGEAESDVGEGGEASEGAAVNAMEVD